MKVDDFAKPYYNGAVTKIDDKKRWEQHHV